MASPVSALNDLLKEKVAAVQDFTLLGWQAARKIFGRPRYLADTLDQMDIIGVGSLPIVILASFFIGAVTGRGARVTSYPSPVTRSVP